MKKLLLIVLCFPTIGFGQDVPLTEKIVSTEAQTAGISEELRLNAAFFFSNSCGNN